MTQVTLKVTERDCRCRICDGLMMRKRDTAVKWYNGATFVLCLDCVRELRAMYEMHRLGATDLTVEIV